jgi:hypothetical protein
MPERVGEVVLIAVGCQDGYLCSCGVVADIARVVLDKDFLRQAMPLNQRLGNQQIH